MLHWGAAAPKQLILWRQQYLAWIERYRDETNNVLEGLTLDLNISAGPLSSKSPRP
jgi:hypothetical protein